MFGITVLLLLATLTFTGNCSETFTCNLSEATEINLCIKQLLLKARSKVSQKADPLRLPDHGDGDLRASGIVIRGLAGYDVRNVQLSFPQDRQISFKSTIVWPAIHGDLDVRIKKCKWVCARVSASPHVSMGSTSGTLETLLTVTVGADGSIKVTPSGTSISLHLPQISVRANLKNRVTRVINRLLGDPASRIATKLSNRWWSNNRGKIEAKARDALNKAIVEDVSPKLSQLLRIQSA